MGYAESDLEVQAHVAALRALAERSGFDQLRHRGGYKPVVQSGSAYLAAL